MKDYLTLVRQKNPLIHSITNYVTVNDVANIILQTGASPVMADSPNEVSEMSEIADCLYINIGTITAENEIAIKNALNHLKDKDTPVVFDPVGCGATKYRTDFSRNLLKHFHFDLIRGNLSEIKSLFGEDCRTKGVDSADNLKEDDISMLKKFAKEHETIIAATGKEDILTDGNRVFLIHNGNELLKWITGTGCMLSAVLACFMSVEKSIESALCGLLSYEIASDISYYNLDDKRHAYTLRHSLFNEMATMVYDQIEVRSDYEEIRP